MSPVSVAATPGVPGERWGGFVFSDPKYPERFTTTPRPSGEVPYEEGIPDGHPGLRTFKDIDEARQALGPAVTVPRPGFIPAGYRLLGVWAIQLDDGRVVDVNLSYAKSDLFTLFGPELTILWTDRAPSPIRASTVENPLQNGAVGAPVLKTEVLGNRAVFQGWANPGDLVGPARVNSSLNWFEDGRLWAVQGEEPLDTLHAIAQSLDRN